MERADQPVTSTDRFCDRCKVVRELHPDPANDDPAEWECDNAAAKADLMDRFYGSIIR